MSDQASNSPPYDAEYAQPNGVDRSHALATIAPAGNFPLSPFGVDPATSRQDAIRGGMDPNSLFHSFRRRWLLAVCMGALAGVVAGVTLYILFPESSSARQLFRVNSQAPHVMQSNLDQEADFETYRRTQSVLISSQFVLIRALNKPGVSEAEFFRDVPQEKRWEYLAGQLSVIFPQDSEIMQVSLSGSVPEEELKMIIEAVSEAYTEEVLFSAKVERMRPREILIESHAKINKDIQRKSEQLEQILSDTKGFSSLNDEIDPETRLLMAKADTLQRQLADFEGQQIVLQSEYRRSMQHYRDPQILERNIDDAIAAMAETQQLEADMLFVKTQIRDMSLSTPNRRTGAALQPLQRRYDFLAGELQRHKEELKQRMTDEARRNPPPEIRLLTQDFQQQVAMLQQRKAKADAEIAEITETLRERGATNTDLMMRKSEIDGLREVQSAIALRIAHWDVEAEAESRIVPIPGIEVSRGINTLQRYGIAGVGAIGCFALACFGISYMEFRNRRLNGPEQVDEGLGIRVIGTLPGLSGRKALDPRHPVVAQLTESIDSVRTALMHESTSSRRQIVMVTSAATMEGRTTVASQLAASLARAGRRALLIDGDLRRPALHNLFDVPLEDGLCEVLRAETDIADVVRPTHAEGLWLITAGYCDADAVHALATDQVQPIFEKLRADYDFIIIDGAPVLGLSDSLLFGQHCDGAILSVLRDHTSVPKIHQSEQLLKSVGIRLIGAVVNGVVTKADRRVTHLQAVTPKSEQKQLEQVEA